MTLAVKIRALMHRQRVGRVAGFSNQVFTAYLLVGSQRRNDTTSSPQQVRVHLFNLRRGL